MEKVIHNAMLLVMVLLCSTSVGQNYMEDVVYLKNGSIVRGVIIE